ncbi:MAG TPA: GNAT family N-acetyltransferase [Kiloniellales bacterium]|nr:GNAT family N-acetyltransferase [Kiloniellales bacterium]
MATIGAIAPAEYAAAVPELAEVLSACVESGAGVSFMLPFPPAAAAEFWRGLTPRVADGTILVLAARNGGRIDGTVQLQLVSIPNQPHRAEVAKMLVHPRARRQGLAEALMLRLELEARRRSRRLLTLDTASDVADRLYRRLGYHEVGVIPGYAYWPDGRLSDTTIFYKWLD